MRYEECPIQPANDPRSAGPGLGNTTSIVISLHFFNGKPSACTVHRSVLSASDIQGQEELFAHFLHSLLTVSVSLGSAAPTPRAADKCMFPM